MRRRTFLTAPLLLSPLLCQAKPDAEVKWNEETDIVVVGGGGAGLSAAVSAAEKGAKVILLEKMPSIGGSTIRASYLGVVDPKRQVPLGISDSAEQHFHDIYEFGGRKGDPKVIRALVDRSPEMLEWLEKLGLRFRPEVIEIYGSHFPRCILPFSALGEGYIRTLSQAALKNGAQIRTSSKAKRLFADPAGRVVGVSYVDKNGKTRNIKARKGVIISSGGFCSNHEMVSKYAPRFKELLANSGPGSTGEMLEAAAEVGADLKDMDSIQCIPGRPKNGRIRLRFHNDVARFIMLDARGRRFVEEDAARNILRDKALALPEDFCWELIDDEGLKSYDPQVQRDAIRGIETGEVFKGDTLEELAEKAGIDPKILVNTVSEYNASLKTRDPKKIPRLPISKGPFWMGKISMTMHYSHGGIRINAFGQALDKSGKVIPGLFAAGEAASGTHGDNRIGGNGLCDALTFGRIAGLKAAE